MSIGVLFVIGMVVFWLSLFAYWHPGSVVLKGLVLIAVGVVGMTSASHLVT